MPEIYLFTWNLNKKKAAHALALKHLALRGAQGPFLACFQELPGKSELARARGGKAVDSLVQQGIHVVSKLAPGPGNRSAPTGLELVHYPAIAHHRDLEQDQAFADADREFIAARFKGLGTTITVVALHAQSRVKMQEDEDRGGARALLRHAINEIPWRAERTLVLGDWNSEYSARETQSWHCLYALRSGSFPLAEPDLAQRRGLDHPPLHVVEPSNASMGTHRFRDTGADQAKTIDFVAVDARSLSAARSQILTTVAAEPVWDSTLKQASVSDHLPVEGYLQV